MAARPLHQLPLNRKPTPASEEPAESSTRIKRSPARSEDAEAAIQASLAAALDQLDHLEIEAPRAEARPAVARTTAKTRGFPPHMPPLPVARALPRGMPPLPAAPKRLPPPLPVAPPPTAVDPPRASRTAPRSAKPLTIALLLLAASGGGVYAISARSPLSLTQLVAAAAHLVRP